ncbi:MAG: GrpB family protein [Culicoidibacterales bacterium]
MILTYATPAFAEKFEQTKILIENIFQGEVMSIEHIGSSSVDNLLTKPIIDILVVVEDIDNVDTMNESFVAAEYEVHGESGIPYRRYFSNETQDLGVHIHVYDQFSKKEILRHRAVRDFLRTHSDVSNDYGRLKQALVEKGLSRTQYQQQKANFVQAVEKLAIVWYEHNFFGMK